MDDTDRTDRSTYAPFILMDRGGYRSLLLTDEHMAAKFAVFEELGEDGWSGNGYDWNSLAQVVVAERLPQWQAQLSFDSEAGMFSAQGSREALQALGAAMQAVFRDDAQIRDLLTRAELD
ncbi:Imm51 family immunity protein [Pseudomonas sp. CGJS7]|uniref:Imm51 family immunity protein n=1 Tax=Pseudomonas sp. CGJS7 TaxID=3109348 RepID=UPI00300B404E